MPIIEGMKLTPPISSTLPKLKRGRPLVTSSPMVAMNRPSSSEATPRARSSELTRAAEVRPREANQKYSKLLKRSAIRARTGAATTRTRAPISPPMAAQTSPAPSAFSA